MVRKQIGLKFDRQTNKQTTCWTSNVKRKKSHKRWQQRRRRRRIYHNNNDEKLIFVQEQLTLRHEFSLFFCSCRCMDSEQNQQCAIWNSFIFAFISQFFVRIFLRLTRQRWHQQCTISLQALFTSIDFCRQPNRICALLTNFPLSSAFHSA